MMVDFDIFCLGEDQLANQEMGIDIPFKDCILKEYTFMSIAYVCPRIDVPEYTIIGSCGDEFTTNIPVAMVIEKIKQAHLIFNFN